MSEEFVRALMIDFKIPHFLEYEKYTHATTAHTVNGMSLPPYLVKSVFRDYLIYEQKGYCVLCRKLMWDEPKGGHVHHDHSTGLIVGAVHLRCNLKARWYLL